MAAGHEVYVNDGGSSVTNNVRSNKAAGTNDKPSSLWNRKILGSSNVGSLASNGYAPSSASRVTDAGSWSVGSSSGLGSDYVDLLRSISEANNAFNLEQTNMVNEFNAKEAQKNRDWQQEMSNTAHQREVKDLIAAGLNPVLSAGGQGAVTGSGAVASGQKAVADNIYGQGVISLMTSMINAASAERVAGIYSAATVQSAGMSSSASRYAADVNARTQANYQQLLRDTSTSKLIENYVSDIARFIPAMTGVIAGIGKSTKKSH